MQEYAEVVMGRLMLIVVALAMVLSSSGSAAVEATTPEDDAPLDVETILANPLDEDAYRTSRHCISTSTYDGVEILDDTTLLFRGRRGIWLNRLARPCRGLRWDSIPTIESHGSRVCEHDRFRGQPRSGFPESMTCTLGKFEKIDEVQVEGLRAARGADPGRGP